MGKTGQHLGAQGSHATCFRSRGLICPVGLELCFGSGFSPSCRFPLALRAACREEAPEVRTMQLDACFWSSGLTCAAVLQPHAPPQTGAHRPTRAAGG